MGVSKNSGTRKSSILIGFSIIFTIHFGVPVFLETPILLSTNPMDSCFQKNCWGLGTYFYQLRLHARGVEGSFGSFGRGCFCQFEGLGCNACSFGEALLHCLFCFSCICLLILLGFRIWFDIWCGAPWLRLFENLQFWILHCEALTNSEHFFCAVVFFGMHGSWDEKQIGLTSSGLMETTVRRNIISTCIKLLL